MFLQFGMLGWNDTSSRSQSSDQKEAEGRWEMGSTDRMKGRENPEKSLRLWLPTLIYYASSHLCASVCLIIRIQLMCKPLPICTRFSPRPQAVYDWSVDHSIFLTPRKLQEEIKKLFRAIPWPSQPKTGRERRWHDCGMGRDNSWKEGKEVGITLVLEHKRKQTCIKEEGQSAWEIKDGPPNDSLSTPVKLWPPAYLSKALCL